MEIKNTVTISLETYEEMKSKIERLEKENAEKTIVKYSYPLENVVVLIIIFGFLFFLAHITYA